MWSMQKFSLHRLFVFSVTSIDCRSSQRTRRKRRKSRWSRERNNEVSRIDEEKRKKTFFFWRLASHLIEQFKDDFRSTIVYVLIDYVHLLSKCRNLSADLKVKKRRKRRKKNFFRFSFRKIFTERRSNCFELVANVSNNTVVKCRLVNANYLNNFNNNINNITCSKEQFNRFRWFFFVIVEQIKEKEVGIFYELFFLQRNKSRCSTRNQIDNMSIRIGINPFFILICIDD